MDSSFSLCSKLILVWLFHWASTSRPPAKHVSFLLPVCSQPSVLEEDATVSLAPGIGPRSLNNDLFSKQIPLSLFAFSLLQTSQIAHSLCTHFWFLGEGCASPFWAGSDPQPCLTSRMFLLFPSLQEKFVSIYLKQASAWGGGEGCSLTPSCVYLICISAYANAGTGWTSGRHQIPFCVCFREQTSFHVSFPLQFCQ